MELEQKEIREVYRYLGYGQNEPDKNMQELIRETIVLVHQEATPRSLIKRVPLIREDTHMRALGIDLTSKALSRNLTGCEEVLLLVATLGIAVDRLLNRNLKLKISKAALIQAAAAAYIESYIDALVKEEADRLSREKLYLRPRFSPGYGDLPLRIQEDFLRNMDATRKIGISLSEGGIMLPEKSVTAIMGISKENSHCMKEGCEACGNKDCAFRRI